MESNFIDWHPADSLRVCARRERQWRRNLAEMVEFLNAGERIIAPMAERRDDFAKALGTDPWVIWPSRYHDPRPMSLSTERS